MNSDVPLSSSSTSRSRIDVARDGGAGAEHLRVGAQAQGQQADESRRHRLPVVRAGDGVQAIAVAPQDGRDHVEGAEMADDGEAAAPAGVRGGPVLGADHARPRQQPRSPEELALPRDLRPRAPREHGGLAGAGRVQQQVLHEALGVLALGRLVVAPSRRPHQRGDRERRARGYQTVGVRRGVEANRKADVAYAIVLRDRHARLDDAHRRRPSAGARSRIPRRALRRRCRWDGWRASPRPRGPSSRHRPRGSSGACPGGRSWRDAGATSPSSRRSG